MSTASQLPGDLAARVIGIVVFDGVSTLDFLGPHEALKAARTYDNYHRAQSCYDVRLLGLTKKFVSHSGVSFRADRTLDATQAVDTLIVPGGEGCRTPDTVRAISSWLSEHGDRVNRIAGIGAGVYPIARSGLLDGRQVTTHWRHTHDLARRFPKLRVNHTAAFLKDGAFYTCGAGRAAIEMTLALIGEDYGTQVALEVAREFVIRMRPAGASEAFAPPPVSEQESMERLADLPAWILAHIDDDLSVEVLAQKAGLSPRHFSRLFKQVFKVTPADFMEQMRLGEARRRLLVPETTITSVASSVGFKSADAFRRAFERRLGVTPSGFRSRFLRPKKRALPKRSPQLADIAA